VASIVDGADGDSDVGVDVSHDIEEIAAAIASPGEAASRWLTDEERVLDRASSCELDVAGDEVGSSNNRSGGGEEAEGEDGSEDSSEAHFE